MANPYVKIRVDGEVVGRLTLLGSEPGNGGPYCFLVVSDEKIPSLISICEGAFDTSERLIGVKQTSTLIGRKQIGTHSARASFAEKIQFMKNFAQLLSERIERQVVHHKA